MFCVELYGVFNVWSVQFRNQKSNLKDPTGKLWNYIIWHKDIKNPNTIIWINFWILVLHSS